MIKSEDIMGKESRAAKECVKYLKECPDSTYVEIGTRHGYSMVAAAPYATYLTAIDPMETMGALPGYGIRELGQQKLFWALMEREDITHKVELIVASSFPWPKELKDRQWDIGLIDGEHTYEALTMDLKNLSPRINKYLILDDIQGRAKTDKALADWFENGDRKWDMVQEVTKFTAVLRRKNAKV